MNTPSTIDALVGLRVLLDEALRRASDPTAVGTHVALILLDGAVERALSHALDSKGVQIRRNDGVEDLHGKACQEFPGWRRNGWQGVRQLHQARNAAQHQAIAPSFPQFSGWTADARAYIGSLILEAFSVDVATVSLASAIDDSELRQPLDRAEAALAGGDADGAVDEALKAMSLAEGKWKAEREDAVGRDEVDSPFGGSTAEKDPAASLRKLVNTLPFANDAGEHVWLESIRSARRRGTPVDPEDAHRAIAHTWGWIVRWQSFSASYLIGRHQSWRESFSVPKTESGGGTRIQSVQVTPTNVPARPDLTSTDGSDDGPQFELVAQLVDVPADEQMKVLRAIETETTNRLRQANMWASIDKAGRLRVRMTADSSDLVGGAIAAGVRAGLQSHEESREKESQEAKRLAEMAAPYESLLSQLEIAPGVPAFKSIRAFRKRSPVSLDDSAATDLIMVAGNPHPDDSSRVMFLNALNQSFADLMFERLLDVAFEPTVISPEDAARLTMEAIALLESWREQVAESKAEAESTARAMARSIEERVESLDQ